MRGRVCSRLGVGRRPSCIRREERLRYKSGQTGHMRGRICGDWGRKQRPWIRGASAKRWPASDTVVLRPDSPSVDSASCASCTHAPHLVASGTS